MGGGFGYSFVMRDPNALDVAVAENLAAAGFTHGFFGRRGGVSSGLYASLNTGPGSADAPEAVAMNRGRVAAALGISEPTRLVSAAQIHSAVVATVAGPWADEPERADGLVTVTPDLALGVLAADCAPVLLGDPAAHVIGAAHAGWRGALAGVIAATVEAMARHGAERARIRAAVGPCIAQEAYEVGPEFVDRFVAADRANTRFFRAGRGDRAHFDLKGYAAARLKAAGVVDIEVLDACTCTAEDQYFSNRRRAHRGEADYGRNISVIRL